MIQITISGQEARSLGLDGATILMSPLDPSHVVQCQQSDGTIVRVVSDVAWDTLQGAIADLSWAIRQAVEVARTGRRGTILRPRQLPPPPIEIDGAEEGGAE